MGATFNFPSIGAITALVSGNFILVDDQRTGKPVKINIDDFFNSAIARGLVTKPAESTPDTIVEFNQLTPTTGGVIFDPNTPTTEGILYVSTVDASTWIYEEGAYITKTYTSSSSTPFFLTGTTIDAGGNKTASIQHNGAIKATAFLGNGLNIVGINASNLATGTVNVLRLGLSGTRDATTFLKGDNTFAKLPTSEQIAISNEDTVLTVGTAKTTFRMTYAMTLTEVRASLSTAGSVSGTTTINVKHNGTTIFSTKLTIDATEKTSVTAAIPPVLSITTLEDNAEITVDIDAVSGGATETGLKLALIGVRA